MFDFYHEFRLVVATQHTQLTVLRAITSDSERVVAAATRNPVVWLSIEPTLCNGLLQVSSRVNRALHTIGPNYQEADIDCGDAAWVEIDFDIDRRYEIDEDDVDPGEWIRPWEIAVDMIGAVMRFCEGDAILTADHHDTPLLVRQKGQVILDDYPLLWTTDFTRRLGIDYFVNDLEHKGD